MKKKVTAWMVVHEDDPCYALDQMESPYAIYEQKDEFLAKILAREIGDGAIVVPCTITY